MKTLVQTVLLTLITAAFILSFAGCQNDTLGTDFGSRDAARQHDEEFYSNVTIEDDFDDSSLLVVLDSATGGVNKKHDDSFFGSFEKEYVRDLTIITDNFELIDEELLILTAR